jgi:pentatricopeptide repeat protein
MYGKCRRVGAARKVFDRLEIRNLVCWNAMILGHCVYGEPGDGIRLFHEMIGRGGYIGLYLLVLLLGIMHFQVRCI